MHECMLEQIPELTGLVKQPCVTIVARICMLLVAHLVERVATDCDSNMAEKILGEFCSGINCLFYGKASRLKPL